MGIQWIWLIIKKEYMLNLISLRFVVACVLSISLTVLSVFILTGDYQVRLKEYSQRSASHFEQLASGYSYEDLLDDEIAVDKAPSLLSIFVQGIERNIEPVVKFRKGEYPVLNEATSENPLFSIFRRIDFLFIVQYIMSLMALFFAYDNISGEKEMGTFKLLFSYPIPRDLIIVGKVIGGFACLVTPLAASFLLSLLVVAIKGLGFSAGDYAGAALIFGASVLFLLCFYVLGIMISTATKSAVTSLFVSLLIWTILIFNIPPLSHLAAKQLFQAPEYATVLSATLKARQELQQNYMDRAFQHGTETGEYPSLDTVYKFYKDEKERGDEKIRRVHEQHEARLRAQIEGAQWLSRLSPVAAFGNAVMQISHTGLNEQYHFINSVRRYQQDLFSMIDRMDKKTVSINPANLPQYTYRRMGEAESLGTAAVDLGIIAMYATIFFAVAYYLFIRYDIR